MSTHHSLLPTTMHRTKAHSRVMVLTPSSTPATVEAATTERAPRWWSRRRSEETPRLSRVDQDPSLAAARLFLSLR